mgnify:FL=1
MYEVELKLRADHESLRERLDDAGANRVESRRQVDTYYDAPHRSFAETDEALRIRREEESDSDEVTKLTYKGPLVEAASKTREEHETVVDDDEALQGVLAGLGFEPAATVKKDRTYYDFEAYTVVLDAVDGLGEFVEVEREVPESEVEAAREDAVDLLGQLGLDPDEQIRTSYLGLLLADD